ncbi:MAG: exosortase system-associated protein, TIGR04073 family [Victivallales bacterium]|nr:exosortase system-associated protein, TIGR04073 family [Victivallales bacterium]
MLLGCVAIFFAMASTQLQASAVTAESEVLDMNSVLVRTELYIWNRFSDLLDVFRGGVALGPGVGAEAAVTNYVQLGAYANCERGMAFPNCIPPFWLVDYYEHNQNAFVFHGGAYATASFGPWRAETGADDPELDNKHFQREKWDVRAQANLFLVNLYLAVRPLEIADFFTGIAGYDLTLDDQKLDVIQVRRPADQFGRGLSNVFFGIYELPSNIFRVTKTEGDMAGATKGVGLGFWRFFCREVVGVVETVTFPFGWEPIIEPAYVLDGNNRDQSWKVYRPSFHKRY